MVNKFEGLSWSCKSLIVYVYAAVGNFLNILFLSKTFQVQGRRISVDQDVDLRVVFV